MATGPPSTSTNPTQPPDQNPPQTIVSWDGDRMFNIYILDYCRKRGYEKTANELAHEADIPNDSQPPINAKQGLLFEWWSVFWVLFAAKSSGQASEDAILYTQHQAQQAAQRQNQTRITQPPVNNRFPNGIPRQGPAPQPGPMANGIGPAHVPPATTMPNGAGPAQPPILSGPRPAIPQQRPNGAPFSSPTIAHSPQAGNAPGPQPTQPGGVGGPMGNTQSLNQMNRSMLPPNGPQSMAGAGPMGGPHQTPQPPFQSLGPSPNQPGSPSQNLVAPSPSMANRQPPGMTQQQTQQPQQPPHELVLKDLARLDTNVMHQLKQELMLHNKEDLSLSNEEKAAIVNLARQRGRLPSNPPLNKPVSQGPPNATAGPSGMNMPNPTQRTPGMGQPPSLQPQPPQIAAAQQRPVKRNSTSPGEDHAQLPRNEQSPPANKRPRTSPSGGEHPRPNMPPQQHPQPPMTPMLPFPPQPQPGPPGVPHMNGMMPRGPMPGFPQHGMPNMMGNPAMASMPMSGGPSMVSHMNPMNPGMMNSGMGIQQYRQSMQNLHKGHLPQGMNMLPSNAASPSGADNQFGGDGPQSRPGTGIPNQFGPPPQGGPNRLGPKPMNVMPPPASPSIKQEPKPGDMNVPSSSPRNPPRIPGQPQNQGMPNQANPASGGHTAPPTPVPSGNMAAPSPSNLLNVSSGMNQPPAPPAPQDFNFGSDLMTGSLEDSFSFGPGDSMDFDRAFGEWFTEPSIN